MISQGWNTCPVWDGCLRPFLLLSSFSWGVLLLTCARASQHWGHMNIQNGKAETYEPLEHCSFIRHPGIPFWGLQSSICHSTTLTLGHCLCSSISHLRICRRSGKVDFRLDFLELTIGSWRRAGKVLKKCFHNTYTKNIPETRLTLHSGKPLHLGWIVEPLLSFPQVAGDFKGWAAKWAAK